jgi:hypothetical protein
MRGPTTGPIRLNVETAPGDTRGRFRLSAYRGLILAAPLSSSAPADPRGDGEVAVVSGLRAVG